VWNVERLIRDEKEVKSAIDRVESLWCCD
jgi:hypothetical protein